MYEELIIYIVAGIAFVGGGLLASQILRPNRPNEEKSTTYESGEDPLGNARASFPIKYYVIALIFLLFEVEIIFLFPWALVFGDKSLNEATNNQWGWLAFIEMTIFLFILIIGLAYAWRKGFLDWEKSELKVRDYKSPVPEKLYQEFNKKIKNGSTR